MNDDMEQSDNASQINIQSYPASQYRSVVTSQSFSNINAMRSGDFGPSIPPHLASSSRSTVISNLRDDNMKWNSVFSSATPSDLASSSRSTTMDDNTMTCDNILDSAILPYDPRIPGGHMNLHGEMIGVPANPPSGSIGGYMNLHREMIGVPANPPSDLYSEQTKKMKLSEALEVSQRLSYQRDMEADYRHGTPSNFNNQFAVSNWLEGLNPSTFGSVTKEIEDLHARRAEMMKPYYKRHPTLAHIPMDGRLPIYASTANNPPYFMANQPFGVIENRHTNMVRDMVVYNGNGGLDMNAIQPVAVIDSADEEHGNQRPFQPFKDIVLNKPAGDYLMKQFLEGDYSQGQTVMGADANIATQSKKRKGKRVHESAEEESPKDKSVCESVEEESPKDKSVCESVEEERPKDKGVYVGVEDDTESEENSENLDANFEGLGDIWQEMSIGLECSKDASTSVEPLSNETTRENEEECEHSFILKDDIGDVCRICGVIGRGIETIIEYQHPKGTRNSRTSWYEGRTSKNEEAPEILLNGMRGSQDFFVSEINAHPRHRKQMKPHQVEGFNFLVNNLVSENPGGCILAHAPGSGKTFMLICFIQSFMAKYPLARPLVVLPRGILPTWKNEFKRWQIEDIPLIDFYAVKAENRSQQLEVLKQWVEERSILFLGYKQFSAIVCDSDTGIVSEKCQEILLTYPSLLILDEGHTPRNKDTDVLTSLEKVQTPRKVVLSGTLYQNHVKEVFNILNLVRPKFLRQETSKAIKKRILSRVPISSRRNVLKKGTDNEFYDLVEHTLVKDDNFRRKVTVIEDLREMTSKVLHYYKGDFLDELPGLVDFSVFLNLTHKQKAEVTELRKLARKFKISSNGSAIYVHPELKSIATNSTAKDRVDEVKIDTILENLDEREGVKAKFFLNLLRLCESSGEKMLVFGQYLLPLKFLERLTMKVKGWMPGKEIFMITGDSDSEFRESSMDRFNNSPDAKIFFGSIKACGEGISLVGASRVIILDVHLNPSVTRQAIGRAFRPGQLKKVYTYRLVAAESPEAEDHAACFKKESIAKMWFEWNEYCGQHDFQMETAVINDCGDQFLESPLLNEDISALYRR